MDCKITIELSENGNSRFTARSQKYPTICEAFSEIYPVALAQKRAIETETWIKITAGDKIILDKMMDALRAVLK